MAEIEIDQAEMATITGAEAAEVFAAAADWLREQPSVTLFGADYDYAPLDPDGQPEPRPFALRLTYLRS